MYDSRTFLPIILGLAILVVGVSPRAATGQTLGCVDCSPCWEIGYPPDADAHKALEGNETSVGGAGVGPHPCFTTGTCEQHHPRSGCRLAQEEQDEQEDFLTAVDALVEAVRSGDVGSALSVLASQHADRRIEYAHERGAIQVLGCNEAVVLHIPIHGRLLQTLAAVEVEVATVDRSFLPTHPSTLTPRG